ncbi:conserved hypothetical protein [Rickettsia prowazekii str. Rp22]|uniref:Uncharacterized protein RP279 n=2 Tax=Rickettsia prowazekii TaxID=782 RepID=Y279_RICPR|nr:RecName: Full=Uncharacterized protein RP279 [Rickettsia prowazekii str. Madrid E]ADE29790.1 conserved hypothetical protein [Rickettsia prowazekii str. Rp22]AMS12195.1 hypothetical protein AR462_01415 [Rickettsia prowazekii]CAA14740.1 unknown [Rickettsia prowazekii str. Madrid E]
MISEIQILIDYNASSLFILCSKLERILSKKQNVRSKAVDNSSLSVVFQNESIIKS